MSNQRTNLQNLLLFLTVLFLPTQLGRHFWPDFSFLQGIRVDYLSPTLYFTDILAFLLIASFLNKKSIIKFKNLVRLIKTPQILTVLAAILLGVLFSKNIPIALYSLVKIFEYILLILLLAKNIQKYGFRIILPAFAFGILFESALTIWQFQSQGSIGGIFYFFGERAFRSSTPNIANASIGGQLILRPYATFSHPNVLAGYLVIGMLFIMLSLSNKFKENILYYSSCFVGSLALVLTMSRFAIFLWILFLGFLFLKRVKLILFSSVGLILIFFVFPQTILRFKETTLLDQSFTDRVSLAKSSLHMIYDHPFFGTGIGNFLNELPHYLNDVSQVIFLQPVHNIFLLTISQIGLIASFIIFFYLYKLFKLTDRRSKHLLMAVAALGFFDHYFLTLQQGEMLLCLVLGIAIGGVIRSNHGAHGNF